MRKDAARLKAEIRAFLDYADAETPDDGIEWSAVCDRMRKALVLPEKTP